VITGRRIPRVSPPRSSAVTRSHAGGRPIVGRARTRRRTGYQPRRLRSGSSRSGVDAGNGPPTGYVRQSEEPLARPLIGEREPILYGGLPCRPARAAADLWECHVTGDTVAAATQAPAVGELVGDFWNSTAARAPGREVAAEGMPDAVEAGRSRLGTIGRPRLTPTPPIPLSATRSRHRPPNPSDATTRKQPGKPSARRGTRTRSEGCARMQSRAVSTVFRTLVRDAGGGMRARASRVAVPV
jgi:hypothetical protein